MDKKTQQHIRYLLKTPGIYLSEHGTFLVWQHCQGRRDRNYQQESHLASRIADHPARQALYIFPLLSYSRHPPEQRIPLSKRSDKDSVSIFVPAQTYR